MTRWKVQEYSNVLSTDIYLKDMRQFIKMIKHGKSLIIPKEKSIETMYEHIIKRLETAIEKHEQKKNRDGKFHSNFKTYLLIERWIK